MIVNGGLVDSIYFREPIVFHELTNDVQGQLDKLTVVRDALAKHHTRVKRSRVTHDDVLSAIRREEMARPIGIRIIVQRHLAELACLDLLVELL